MFLIEVMENSKFFIRKEIIKFLSLYYAKQKIVIR